ncbi:sensor histidine kinase [Thalassobacillus pellis]|uniref:sensor histidine kinase n=1 Tax=Thalassobacillus pellis TaxID=748008 RepID=UPI0019607058|nr:sensor histidine kinase [Thalassobacillus pellis]MBM7552130.1 OmpR family two-component system bacitracin resistance sensor histidine kinase BceS [Thalassobacillus pellis]
MIWKFCKERLSWILFFLFLQLLAVLLAYLDTTLPLRGMLYYVFLSTLFFIVFLIIRGKKELKFYRELEEREEDADITSLPYPDSPFESIVEKSITEPVERLRTEIRSQRTLLEQEKDELLAWIHEVKTPLTTMQLIMDRMSDQELKKQLMREWLRIHFLLDQQLHQKRIPTIENDLFIEKVNLEPLIFREIHTLRSWCMQKGIGFETDLPSEAVLSDGKWLAFIIRQLLTNAVKYSEEGSEIKIISFSQNGRVSVKVTDTGRGIESRDLPRIFDKGFTSTTKHEENAATGMGLYLAEQAASTLHITIDVDSTPDRGSTFTLTFPKENEFLHIQGLR